MEKFLVFVYGTLKRGYYNHISFLYNRHDAKFIGAGETVRKINLYDLGPYPFAVMSKRSKSTIKGEVYEVGPDVLNGLDFLESYPQGYDRKIIKIKLETGEIVKAWIYFMHIKDEYNRRILFNSTLVTNGLWRDGKIGIFDMETVYRENLEKRMASLGF